MIKPMRFFLLPWIAILGLIGCQTVTPQASVPVMQTATLASTDTPAPPPAPPPSSSPTASATSLPTATLAPTLTPIPTPRFAGLLAFLGTDEYAFGLTPGRLDLFLLDGNGQITRLTEGAAVSDVAWSPDGHKLLFSAIFNMEPTGFDLYQINVDGSNLMPIPIELKTLSNEEGAVWSPDGQKIVFSQFLGGKERIYIMNADGSDVRFLVEGADPCWSPDGQNIVFIKRLPEGGVGKLYMIDVDGGELRQLTNNVFGNKPIFSPDGDRIAFSGYDINGQNAGIYIIQVDGSGLTKVTNDFYHTSWFSTTQLLSASENKIFTIGIVGGARRTLIQLPENFYIKFAVLQPGIP